MRLKYNFLVKDSIFLSELVCAKKENRDYVIAGAPIGWGWRNWVLKT